MAEYQSRQHRQQDETSLKNHFDEKGPSSSKFIAVATLVPVTGTLLFLAGISLIGTLVGGAIATPIFIIFSPILVPAALLIAGSIAGFLTSGAFGIIGLSSISWIANQVRGTRGVGSNSMSQQVDQAKERTMETARYLGKKTKDVGEKIKNKSQDEGGKIQEEEVGSKSQEGKMQQIERSR